MNDDARLFHLTDRSLDQFGELMRADDPIAGTLGALAAIATPTLIVHLIGALTNTQGGAAIMKSLALAGSIVGEGALYGITIMGIGAVAVGWTVKGAIRRLRLRIRAEAESAATPPREKGE